MYPFLRMTLVIRSEARKPPLGIFDTHERSMLCLPFDADMFWEMNNGRILTFYDLGRIGLAQRTGLMRTLKAQGWGLVVAGGSVRYRARIRPFQRFDLRTRLLGWDARFIYLEQAMWRGDTACNHALLRTGVTERGKLVATDRVAEAMGLSEASPPLPDWVTRWIDADTARPWPPGV
jgi:acyl-CoA thioesterase FadM